MPFSSRPRPSPPITHIESPTLTTAAYRTPYRNRANVVKCWPSELERIGRGEVTPSYPPITKIPWLVDTADKSERGRGKRPVIRHFPLLDKDSTVSTSEVFPPPTITGRPPNMVPAASWSG